MSATETQIELLEFGEGEMISPSAPPPELVAVANRVRDGLRLVVTKLTQLAPDLAVLRAWFAERKRGHANFLGYNTWETFIEGYLRCSPRRVQQLLAGPKTDTHGQKPNSPIADAKDAELTKLLIDILGQGKVSTARGYSDGFRVSLVLTESSIRNLAEHFQSCPAEPPKKSPEQWKERFAPDVIAQAEAEMRGAVDLANMMPKAGRYFSENTFEEHPLAGRYDVKAGERPAGSWSGIGSQKENIAGQFPWFTDENITISKIEKALESKGGVDYERIVSKIAAAIQAEREAADLLPF